MPCVYNQAVRVAIGADVRVVDMEEEGVEGIVGSDTETIIINNTNLSFSKLNKNTD